MSQSQSSARRCVVLGVAPRNPDEDLEGLAQKVFAVSRPSLCIQWHGFRRRQPPTMNADDEEEGEDDSKFTLLVSCSISESGECEKEIVDAVLDALGDAVEEAEVWLAAPCQVPLHDVTLEKLFVKPEGPEHEANEGDKAVADEILRRTGMVAIKEAVSAESVGLLSSAVDARIQLAEEAVRAKHPEIKLGVDLFAFRELSSRGSQRFDLLFEEQEQQEQQGGGAAAVFGLARNGPWVPLVQRTLGDDCLCQVSVVYSRPGADHQDWHTDGAHQGRIPQEPNEVSPPYAVCVFLALIDLDYSVGFTQFWPGSHWHPALAGFGASAPVLGCSLDGVLPAGGAVLYDYRLMHRGMANRSAGTQRPVLQFLYHQPSYQEKKNYGAQSLLA